MGLFSGPNLNLIVISLIFAAGILLQESIASSYLIVLLGAFLLLTDQRCLKSGSFLPLLLVLQCLLALDLISGLHWNRSLLMMSHYYVIGLIYLYCRYSLDSSQQKSLAMVVLILTLINCVGGLFQVFISSEPQPLSWVPEGALKRAFGLFDNPNLLASCVMMSGFLVYKTFRESESKWMLTSVLCFLIFSLILTQSRGAIIGFTCGMLIISIYEAKKYRYLTSFFVLLCLMGLLLISEHRSLVVNELGVNQRLEMLKGILNYLRIEWLSGSGAGTFHLEYPQYRTLGGVYPLYAHNHILEIWCELGLAGLILILTWIYYGLSFSWRCRKEAPVILGFVMACLINSSTNQSFSYFLVALFFVIVLSLISSRHSIDSFKNSRKITSWWKLGTLICFSMGIYKYQFDTLVYRFHKSNKLPFSSVSQIPPLWKVDLSLYGVYVSQKENNPDSKSILRDWGSYLQSIYPNESIIPFYLAKLSESDSNVAALHAYRALSLDPFSEQYTAWLMRLEYSRNNYSKVIDLAEKVIGSNPQYEGINIWYDDIYQIYLFSLVVEQQWDKLNNHLKSNIKWINKEMGAKVERISREAFMKAHPNQM